MKKTVLLTANYKGQPLEIVKSIVPEEFSLLTMETKSHDELVDKAQRVEYILASGSIKIDKDVLVAAKNLKMVQRLGVGLDSLDLNELCARNIPVYVNSGINANSVAEHTVMLILASLRKLTIINYNTKNGIWKKQEQGVKTRDLSVQTVGIIGMGNIGSRVASLLQPFGCNLVYYSVPRLSTGYEEVIGLEYMELDKLFHVADIITLHLPLNEKTDSLICCQSLSKMKDGVIIINTSRGGLINEYDLLNALNSGKVGFAGLDVYREEPTDNLELVKHAHIICTPHIAGNTFESFSNMMLNAFRSISLFDSGNTASIEKNRIY